jgi:hypothetical protein
MKIIVRVVVVAGVWAIVGWMGMVAGWVIGIV